MGCTLIGAALFLEDAGLLGVAPFIGGALLNPLPNNTPGELFSHFKWNPKRGVLFGWVPNCLQGFF